MTVNLASPYRPIPSPPRSLEVQFVAPGQDDFLFAGPGAPRIVCIPGKRAIALEWSLARNCVETPFLRGTGAARFDNGFTIDVPAEGLEPGFFDLRVSLRLTDAETLEGRTTFGWRHEEMGVHPLRPEDFDEFWSRGLAKIDAVPPQPVVTLERTLQGKEIGLYNVQHAALPENYDPEGAKCDEVEVYRVRFASCDGATVEGWFAKPVGPGPFPGLLVLPGAGNNARPAPVEHARHGYATLDVQVHAQPVDAASYTPAPDDSPVTRPEEKNHYAIYLHAVQAARALPLLPGVDRERLAVLGGSQGGRLTVVVAALDPSFRAAVPAIAHFAYMPWLHGVMALNARKSPGDGAFTPAAEVSTALRVDSYFDVLNFAPRVRCPVLMNAGLTDRVSPPTGIFAIYRALPGEKELVPLPNIAHDWAPAFDRYAWRWLERTLAR
ncbi:MAG TPA: acetylxylan esterase [Candidatus Methylacidiphilales bacterium]|jgi:cephalosporin-C deacetylase|nr:acetylxylan esterase [Candidatus Methylacidiphilales bacterium]